MIPWKDRCYVPKCRDRAKRHVVSVAGRWYVCEWHAEKYLQIAGFQPDAIEVK